jgi:phosphate:Na+ symporter
MRRRPIARAVGAAQFRGMSTEVLRALGGVGLFLIGIAIMTRGLRAVAGPALRAALARLTASPWSGAATGAVATALLHSSSAVTVTAVGFVGAGLLSFPQALGLILGANVGTTVTGWTVALLGIGLKIGAIAGPLVLLGALLRLFARGRAGDAGWALAGFGVAFMGLAAMQEGLAAYEGLVTPADFPGDDLAGRLRLVGIGLVLTLVTQSSTVGVASALVAVDAGAISLPQAAAMVIGMDVGTTSSALLATLGGTAAMRRTGWAHVVFNLMSGAMAFLLLAPFGVAASAAMARGVEPTVLLAAFHSGFNLLSVIIALPFADRLARLLERLVPERRSAAVARLRPALLAEPPAALAAALAALRDLAGEAGRTAAAALAPGGPPAGHAARVAEIAADLAVARSFLERIGAGRVAEARDREARAAALHALDHLSRLTRRFGQAERPTAVAADPGLARMGRFLRRALDAPPSARRLRRCEVAMDGARRAMRAAIIDSAAAGALDGATALARLDAARWLHRAAYHQWRTIHHLDRAGAA